MDKTDLCRLCALDSAKDELISLFDEQGLEVLVAEKIKKLLNIELTKSNNLPKSICTECCNKLEAFEEFLNASINAQVTLSLLFPEDKGKEDPLPPLEDLCKQVDCISPLQEEFLPEEGVNPKDDSLYDVNTCDLFSSEKKGVTRPPDTINGGSDKKTKEKVKKQKEWIADTWLCSDCSEVSSSLEELKLHHNNDHKQDVRFMCVICSKMFLLYTGFIAHMKRHTIPSCEFCGKDFCDKKTLERHRATHSSTKPFVCPECGRGFRHQHALLVHSKCHLPEDIKNKYPCQLCDKKFSTKPNLRSHTRIHTGVKDFTCDQCGKGFTQKGNLDAHLATHSPDKPFACQTCDKRFKSEMQVKKHQTIHTNERPFQCDVCGQTFREKRNLREHHRIHTGVLPYSCEFCGKSFRFRGILATHRRIHTGERPYSCAECQHHFTNWPNYNKHMKRRHGVDTSRTSRALSLQHHPVVPPPPPPLPPPNPHQGNPVAPLLERRSDNHTKNDHHELSAATLVMYSDHLDDVFGGHHHHQVQYTGAPTADGHQFVYTIDPTSGLDIIHT